jgi:hypothetical protein
MKRLFHSLHHRSLTVSIVARFIGLMAAGCFLALLIPSKPFPDALQATMLGSTNSPSGSPMALVSVTNNTAQARYFYFAAEVATATGWTDVKGWVERQGGRTQRLAGHASCQVMVPSPESSAKWRLRCASVPEESRFKWTWYGLVRRIGLGRFGFREGPSGSYSWTTPISL